jgi:hypothetical protein
LKIGIGDSSNIWNGLFLVAREDAAKNKPMLTSAARQQAAENSPMFTLAARQISAALNVFGGKQKPPKVK